jgi:predicted nucleic acid-binding Zn ribbon protein
MVGEQTDGWDGFTCDEQCSSKTLWFRNKRSYMIWYGIVWYGMVWYVYLYKN